MSQGQNRSQQQRRQEPQQRNPGHDALTNVFNRIAAEMKRALEKHGDQSHLPIVGGRDGDAGRKYHERLEYNWKFWNDTRSAKGHLGWDGILLEEVHEAFASDDIEHQIEELTQVAAMAVRTILILEGRR